MPRYSCQDLITHANQFNVIPNIFKGEKTYIADFYWHFFSFSNFELVPFPLIYYLHLGRAYLRKRREKACGRTQRILFKETHKIHFPQCNIWSIMCYNVSFPFCF